MPRFRLKFGLRAIMVGISLVATTLASFIVTENDKRDATRDIIARFLNGNTSAGLSDGWYFELGTPPEQTRFIVICDHMPPDAVLSSDPRVQRIRMTDYDDIFAKSGFDRTKYLTIELKSSTAFTATFEISTFGGPLAGAGFTLTYRKFLFRLRSSSSLNWVS
jgi:hypothetical protein